MTTLTLTPDDIVEINEVTRHYEHAVRHLRLDQYATPQNLADERRHTIEAWQRDEPYDPRFIYTEPPEGLERSIEEVLRGLRPVHAVSRLLVEDLERTREMIVALRSRDGDAITQLTVAEHGEPSSELVARAMGLLDQSPTNDPSLEEVTSELAVEMLSASLRSAGLDGWTVAVDPLMSARMSVNSIDSRVRVQQSAVFSAAEIHRLRVHELGTHVARAENGRQQPLAVLGMGVPGYLVTEEGLAAWHEDRWDVADQRSVRRYALRVVAVHLALTGGFFDVLSFIAEHTDAVDAFAITQRSKRGFLNTGRPGAHVKDQVYLQGLVQVGDHLERHPDDLRLLMAGKIGLQHLNLVRSLDDMGLLVAPRLSPASFST